MIVSNPGNTNLMEPQSSTSLLTDRQLWPPYPIATTQGSILTPDELGWSGMAGLPSDMVVNVVAILGILALLYWLDGK